MIHYSQRDPRWINDRLGNSDLTLGTYGCLVTACATALTFHGMPVTPKDLNVKLRAANGFAGGLMYFSILQNLFPVSVNLVQCENVPAPIADIDEMLEKNLPVIVELDYSTKPGFQNHWVLIYQKEGNDYLISDPYDKNPDQKVLLTLRFGFGKTAAQVITRVLYIIPDEPVVVPESPSESPNIPTGNKLEVLLDGLRLRTGPNLNAQIVSQLNARTELVSAGEPVVDGAVTWQPVLLYVASGSDLVKYIRAK